jgi:hypothetical protein
VLLSEICSLEKFNGHFAVWALACCEISLRQLPYSNRATQQSVQVRS